jgi:hypothetical protein
MTEQPQLLTMPKLPQEAFPPPPVCWIALTNTDRSNALKLLTEWVSWLVDRYTLDHRMVPPCWAQHGALLEELSALHTAWHTAYAITSRGDMPLDWHAQFDAARHRLTDWVARMGCRPGEHRTNQGELHRTQPSYG